MKKLAAIVLACGLAAAFPAQAQDTNFAGKVIKIVVSGGGGYEAYARLMARYMPAYLPGKPSIIVQEMPGGGGIRAASYLYNIAPRDGTVIGAVHGSVLTSPQLSPTVVDFDVTKFNWIGNASSDTYIGYVTRNSPVQSLEEAKTREVVLGGTSLGSTGIDLPLIGQKLFGLKFKIIPGYRTSDETKLAMERGEIHGTGGTTWGSLKATDMLERNFVKVIFQHGATPHPELKDVPLFSDLAKNDTERQILDFMRVRGEIARPYLAPPGIAPAQLALFREAFMKVVTDQGFKDDVTRMRLEFDSPIDGAALAKVVERAASTPPAVVKQIEDILATFNGK